MTGSVRVGTHVPSEPLERFEIRMRQRRAQRCVRTADAALEAGRDKDARAALAEARALGADPPAFDTLRDAVRARRAAAAAARRRVTIRRYALPAALLVVAATGAFWLPNLTLPPAATTSAPPAATSVTPTATVARGPQEPPAVDGLHEEAPVPAVGGAADVAARRIEKREMPALERTAIEAGSRSTLSPMPAVPPAAQAVLPTVPDLQRGGEVNRTLVGDVAQTPQLPAPVKVDQLVTDLPTPAPSPPPISAAAAPDVTPPAAAEPVAESEESKVRSVLARFESAYSALDAAAAQRVWLEVDEPALSRAFGSLQSQRVSLGHCTVAVRGLTSTAVCNGTTTWTPKIGGGTRTAPRRWQFDLARHNEQWLIVRAQGR